MSPETDADRFAFFRQLLRNFGLEHLGPVIERRIMEGQSVRTIIEWVQAQAGDPPSDLPPA